MLKFYHLTDLHAYAKSNWRECDPYELERDVDQVAYRESEEIIKRAVEIILEDKEIDVVIVTGDLTSCGDKDSHDMVIEQLRRLKEAGKRVYAFTASHDFPWENCPFWYDKEGGKIRYNENVTDFKAANELYREFGFDGALAVNEENYSYVVSLDENTRFMAVCVDYYNSHLPSITEASKKWIREQAKKAKEDGVELIAGCHHPILMPSPVYRAMGKGDVIKDPDEIIKLFTECGIRLALTGHSHIHDVEYHKDENGMLFDVSTAALAGFPPVMRKISYDNNSGEVDVKTITIKSVENEKIKIDDLYGYCRNSFVGYVEGMIVALGADIDDFAEKCDALSMDPDTVRRNAIFIKPVGKFLNNLTFGKLGNWTRKETGFKKADYADVKDEKVVPFVITAVEKLYAGDAEVAPESKEYKIFMALVSVLDSVVERLPLNLKKFLGCDSITELAEPLFYNNGLSDNDVTFNLNVEPKPNKELPKFKSRKGIYIILIIILAVLMLLPILLPLGIIIGSVVAVKKLFAKKK